MSCLEIQLFTIIVQFHNFICDGVEQCIRCTRLNKTCVAHFTISLIRILNINTLNIQSFFSAAKKTNQFSRLCPKTYKSFVILSCWPSKVKIISAFYGRINDSHCQGDSKPFKPCSVNGITELLTKKCSGKDTCFLDASKEALRSLDDPCPNVEKYVEVTSTCA